MGDVGARRRGALRRAHEAFTSGGRVRLPPVRPLVADSWRRSARARVSPDGAACVEPADEELAGHRDEHPLSAAMPVIREQPWNRRGFSNDLIPRLLCCWTHGAEDPLTDP